MKPKQLQSIQTSQFKRDLKKLKKQNKDLKKLQDIVLKLLQGKQIAGKYKDHALKGNWKYRRECHVEPDWLLIYKIEKEQLILERTGSHSDLFD